MTEKNTYIHTYNDAASTADDICRQTIREKCMKGLDVNIQRCLREPSCCLPRNPEDITNSQSGQTGYCLNSNQTQYRCANLLGLLSVCPWMLILSGDKLFFLSVSSWKSGIACSAGHDDTYKSLQFPVRSAGWGFVSREIKKIPVSFRQRLSTDGVNIERRRVVTC
jgi:hypothetical protein